MNRIMPHLLTPPVNKKAETGEKAESLRYIHAKSIQKTGGIPLFLCSSYALLSSFQSFGESIAVNSQRTKS